MVRAPPCSVMLLSLFAALLPGAAAGHGGDDDDDDSYSSYDGAHYYHRGDSLALFWVLFIGALVFLLFCVLGGAYKWHRVTRVYRHGYRDVQNSDGTTKRVPVNSLLVTEYDTSETEVEDLQGTTKTSARLSRAFEQGKFTFDL